MITKDGEIFVYSATKRRGFDWYRIDQAEVSWMKGTLPPGGESFVRFLSPGGLSLIVFSTDRRMGVVVSGLLSKRRRRGQIHDTYFLLSRGPTLTPAQWGLMDAVLRGRRPRTEAPKHPDQALRIDDEPDDEEWIRDLTGSLLDKGDEGAEGVDVDRARLGATLASLARGFTTPPRPASRWRMRAHTVWHDDAFGRSVLRDTLLRELRAGAAGPKETEVLAVLAPEVRPEAVAEAARWGLTTHSRARTLTAAQAEDAQGPEPIAEQKEPWFARLRRIVRNWISRLRLRFQRRTSRRPA